MIVMMRASCTLCFVAPPMTAEPHDPHNPAESTLTTTTTTTTGAAATTAAGTAGTAAPPSTTTTSATTASPPSLHPTVDYWRDLALDKKIWEDEEDTLLEGGILSFEDEEQDDDASTTKQDAGTPTPEKVQVTSPLYGPGKHQEDLIESVVLRSAHYPGHWDASKDSLWVALPAPNNTTLEHDTANAAATIKGGGGGDAGWLGQLRESIASAADAIAAINSPDKKAQDDADNKEGSKETEVSDFFASLLKNP